MKAIRIHSYGGPEVLVYEEAPRPEPGPGEVLIKVHAAALNPVDRYVRAGYFQGIGNLALPFTPGLDLAGVIEALGDGVNTFAVGDAVYGYLNLMTMRQGAYAEYTVARVDEIAPKPASLDVVSAAAVPLAGLTAWQALFDIGGLEAGQTVLIHGAGGGSGSLAVQFARAKGARVLATAGSDKIGLLRELGVAEAIDYTTTRFEDVARDVDVVLDGVGGELQGRSLSVLKPGGIYVSPAGKPDVEAAQVRGVRASGMMTQTNAAQLSEIAALIDAGAVTPIVSTVLPLAEAAQAHTLLEAGHVRGKIVLRVEA